MSRRVLVAGSIAAKYRNGGIAWERLSWVLGLRQLGLDAVLVDQLDRARCVHAGSALGGYDDCLNREYFVDTVERFGLTQSASLIGEAGEHLAGIPFDELLDIAREAELLVNVAGNLRLEDLKRAVGRAVFVDVDPGLTQLWLAAGEPTPRVAGHDLHFTIGENVGMPGCDLPAAGIRWLHTRQPAVLAEWPVAEDDVEPRLTTLARWRGSGPHGHLAEAGLSFDDKADQFVKLLELPRRSGRRFEVALDALSDGDARQLLEGHGWHVVEGAVVSRDPDVFRRYVQGSWAECSVAKGAYVDTWSGWFSDRSVRYLSSGRPTLVQDTGFGRTLPVGEGLLAFQTVEDAVAGVEAIAADYDRHRVAARRIAEEYFDSDLVLTRFLEDALA